MGKLRCIEKSEATYCVDSLVGEGHFSIDCKCGGKSGSHYKNTSPVNEKVHDRYFASKSGEELKHTYYLTDVLFLDILNRHRKSEGKEPLVIVCDDCENEFPFTLESYQELIFEIAVKHNKLDASAFQE